jgi:hypothetical protein
MMHLLGGANRGATRPRGFTPWTPRGDNVELLAQVREVSSHRQLAPTNFPRRGFLLEITELPSVKVFGAARGAWPR